MNLEKAMIGFEGLFEQLKGGKIAAIEYGVEGEARGYMSAFQLLVIETLAGNQMCFKNVSGGMLGSGHYMAFDADKIREEAVKRIEKYHTPHPNPKIQEFVNARRAKAAELKFFAIPKE